MDRLRESGVRAGLPRTRRMDAERWGNRSNESHVAGESAMGPAGGFGSETELRKVLRDRVGESRYSIWFGEAVTLGIDGESLKVAVPNTFFRDRIQNQFGGSLIEAAEAVAGRPLRLLLQVARESERSLEADTAPGDPEPAVRPADLCGTPSVAESRGAARSGTPPARVLRRLEDFVTGPSNRLALAAAIDMATRAGQGFNPLVIQAPLGMGKTHLLEGMTLAMRSRSLGGSVVLTTAEAFTNSFLDAMRASGLGAFRQRFRRAAALLVDDIHFLAAKRATQDEFLHTFNALMEAEVPIVLATDTHPRSIPKLSEELATRFLGGMLVRIDAPDLATRNAIVLAKAAARGVDLPKPVADFLAEHLRSSVRELEGALQTVMAHAQLTGRKLDLSLARSALRDTIRHTNASLALHDVERAVCEVFQIEGESLRSETRARTVAQPRMLAMYLARKHTRAAFGEIGRHFGDRNHSTVIAAIRRVESWLRDETRISLLSGFESVHDLVATLEQRLGSA